MADLESIGVSLPVIDDRPEENLYQQAQNVVANRSGGVLNDFSDHGPLGVFLRAQSFASAELLYRVNKLPLALVIKLLETTGVERVLGAKATVTLTFSLTAARTVPFTIAKGFSVVDAGGAHVFTTDAILTIPPGQLTGTVTATAVGTGPSYNVAAFALNVITQPLAFLASVINLEPAQGGTDEETVEAAIARGLAALRNRSPVSALDFETRAEAVMGSGSRAKAIGLLGADTTSRELGAVHLFLLDPSGDPANAALLADVRTSIGPNTMLGTSLYLSPMPLLPVSANVVAQLQPGADPAVVLDALWAAYQRYLSPTSFEPGADVLRSEVQHVLRLVAGLEFIDELRLNDVLSNIPAPNEFTLPTAYSLTTELVDGDGNMIPGLRGAGEAPDYNPNQP